jgi:hypothetical protein
VVDLALLVLRTIMGSLIVRPWSPKVVWLVGRVWIGGHRRLA